MTVACRSHHAIIAVVLVCCWGTLLSADDGSTPASAVDRPRLLLDGTWDFRLDPEKQGEAGQWWSANVDYPERISVPRIWQAQGFGEPGGIVRHNYEGAAWYRRSFTAPETWAGRRIWLRFEGICNHGDVYLNGHKVGLVETFITPYEFDVTEQIAFGKENVLACRVDSGGLWQQPVASQTTGTLNWTGPAWYLGSYVGMMQFLVHAGGINSQVIVEARPDPRLDEVVVKPNLLQKTVQAKLRLVRQVAGEPWAGQVTVRIAPAKNRDAAVTATIPVSFAAEATESLPAEGSLALPELHPWSPEDPFLYVVETVLEDAGQAVDQQTIRTGFRELTVTEDGNFLLNGKPYYLRGVGYDSLEPITGVPVPDKKVYAERMRLLKQYGFNYLRLLAHTPLAEFFEAADEEGMFVQTEGEWFLGGTPMPEQTGELFSRQIPKMIREFRHHPCWYAFSCFNEAFGAEADPVKQAYIQAAYKTFRAMDPERFFIASDGGIDQWPTDVITDRMGGIMAKADVPDSNSPEARPTEVFQGALDEAVLFDKAISHESMHELAATEGEAGSYPTKVAAMQPIACWPLDDQGAPGRIGGALLCGTGGQQTPGLVLAERAEELVSHMQKGFSIALWAKPDPVDAGVFGNLFSCGAAMPGGALLLTYRGDGHLVVGCYGVNILTSKATLRTGAWNHVGLTWDGRRVQLFLDGRPDSEVDALFALPGRDMALGRLIQRGARGPAEYRSRPHVWHEFNNTYIGPLPDLDIEKRLTGVMTQVGVIEPHRRRMEGYGLLSRYPELRKRSFDLYWNHVKSIFEDARRLPRLDGYAWWGTTSDIPAGVETDVSSLAVLDMLYQPEKFVFEEFRKVNRESVLLVDANIDRRVLAGGESRSLAISLSHFGPEPVRNGRLVWKIRDDKNVLTEGVLEPVSAECWKITELGSIPLGPFDGDEPRALHVEVELLSDACHQSNDWRFWVLPARKKNLPTARLCNLTGEESLGTRYGISTAPSLAEADLVFARNLTPEVFDYLRGGGRVIFLTQDAERSSVHCPGIISNDDLAPVVAAMPRTTFVENPGLLGYWARWIRCNAQIVEKHDALATFPHEGFSDFQLMRLFGQYTTSIDLSRMDPSVRSKVNPIIWALDLAPWSDDPTPCGVALTWHGLVGECRVERGKALLCTLYVLDGVKAGLPEAGYLLDCLVDYAMSERFEPPAAPLAAEEAKRLFREK